MVYYLILFATVLVGVLVAEGILILKFNDLLKELKELIEFLHGHHHGPVVYVAIIPKESNVADVVEGGTFLFTVQGFNKGGKSVPLTDAAVGVDDPAIGSDTVNADGTGGVLTAGAAPASGNITATAAGLTATPFQITVVADNVVASVTIVPTP